MGRSTCQPLSSDNAEVGVVNMPLFYFSSQGYLFTEIWIQNDILKILSRENLLGNYSEWKA